MLGQHELDEMLAERDKLNADIQRILDEQTDAWGIKVSNVEIKHVDLDESMIRAIARQAEAERMRRAKIIDAEGELQAAERFMEAAKNPRRSSPGAPASLSDDHERPRGGPKLADHLPASPGNFQRVQGVRRQEQGQGPERKIRLSPSADWTGRGGRQSSGMSSATMSMSSSPSAAPGITTAPAPARL